MVTISPTILAKDAEEFARKIAAVKPLGLTVHIDVMDGRFVPVTTFAPVDTAHHLVDGLRFDAHLMIDDPEHYTPAWIAGGAGTVYFHVEATTKGMLIHRATAEQGFKVGIALNPDTPLDALDPYLGSIRNVMVMAVKPGWSGQQFDERAYERIRALRAKYPNARIAVDGGVKPENALKLAQAGANVLMVGSALTDAADPAVALAAFRAALGDEYTEVQEDKLG